jgi:organic radical activating enzyme
MIPSMPAAFTPSTLKLLRHPAQLTAYREKTGQTAIGTHISLTGACNLSCDYCAYAGRNKAEEVSLDVLKDYVTKLALHGLKSVTLTGGGEPTMHPNFNEFVEWLDEMGLAIGLITNGTMARWVSTWEKFAWVRVSINIFEGWRGRVWVPADKMASTATFGCAFVYTNQTVGELATVAGHSQEMGAEYLRIAPSFMEPPEVRERLYRVLEDKLMELGAPNVSLARSELRAPECSVCRLPHFRPCLSERGGGTVYPCWRSSLPETDGNAICRAGEVGDWLESHTPAEIMPFEDCPQCPCAETVEALVAWGTGRATTHDLFV